MPQNGNFFKKCPLLAFAFTKCWPSYESGLILKISTDLGFFYRKTTQKKWQSDLKDFFILNVTYCIFWGKCGGILRRIFLDFGQSIKRDLGSS